MKTWIHIFGAVHIPNRVSGFVYKSHLRGKVYKKYRGYKTKDYEFRPIFFKKVMQVIHLPLHTSTHIIKQTLPPSQPQL